MVAGVLIVAGAGVGYEQARRGLVVNIGEVPGTRSPAAPETGLPAAQPGRSRASPARPRPSVVHSFRAPTRLRVPSLGVDARVVPVGVDRRGGLGIPTDPRRVGWWAGSAAPAASAGGTVLVGHVDSATAGPGALFLLREVALGRIIRVSAGRATYAYAVTGVRTVPKATLPSLGLLNPRGPRRLVIVTCGGPFDRTTDQYLDNLVVYARPVARHLSRGGRAEAVPPRERGRSHVRGAAGGQTR